MNVVSDQIGPYEVVCQLYRELTAQGASVYPPDPQSPANPELARNKALKKFGNSRKALARIIKQRDDPDLDRYLLPHPLL